MSKYGKYQRVELNRSQFSHPVWRGIGCLLMVIVPLMSYGGAVMLVDNIIAHGWPFPIEYITPIQFPSWAWRAPILPTLLRPIANYPHLLADLVAFIILLLLFTGVFSTLYAIIYRITGPSRYTSLDAPPPRRRTKVYKR